LVIILKPVNLAASAFMPLYQQSSQTYPFNMGVLLPKMAKTGKEAAKINTLTCVTSALPPFPRFITYKRYSCPNMRFRFLFQVPVA
jgi:hypothetical protein